MARESEDSNLQIGMRRLKFLAASNQGWRWLDETPVGLRKPGRGDSVSPFAIPAN
jgi:hypothetical protein